MRKLFRFIIMFILSGVVFGIMFSNSFNFSLDSVFGKIYDYATPDARQNFLTNVDSICKLMESGENNPKIKVQLDPRINQEELSKICKKNLKGRELFVEFVKSQMVNIDVVLNNYPIIKNYSNILNPIHINTSTFIILILILLVLLFLVEKNVHDFLRTIGKFLLATSLIFLFIYALPKVIMQFANIDTSFLLKVNNDTNMSFDQKEILTALLPIILNEMLNEKMLVCGIIMLISSVAILLFLYVRNKSTKQ